MEKTGKNAGAAFLAVLFSATILFLAGCATSDFGVKQEGIESWIEEHQYTALSGDGLSLNTKSYLQRGGKVEEYEEHPDVLLKSLHAEAWKKRDRKLVAALIELCYAQAKEHSDPEEAVPYYLSSAVYAYTYLFDKRFSKKPSPYEPEFLHAVRFYNYASAKVFRYLTSNGLVVNRNFSISYLTGKVEFESAECKLPYKLSHFTHFEICYEYSPYGFHMRTRQSGLGVPFVGIGDMKRWKREGEIFDIGSAAYPGTMLLRFVPDGENDFKVTPEYLDPMETTDVTIDGDEVPLEADLSTYLGFVLNDGSRISPLLSMMNPDRMRETEGLYMLSRYDKRKIPVVFVHGLMSYPRAWTQMINTLLSDPVMRTKYQFWLFAYPTANPILYSASKLRRSLYAAREKFDPKHANKNFDKMVLVGHSMGGLLSKIMVQNAGNVFLERLLGIFSLEEIEELDPKQKAFLREMAMYKRVPFVNEVIFLNVPHRGSMVTRWTVAVWAAKLISLPKRLVSKVVEINKKLLTAARLREHQAPDYVSTGVDNLDPDNPTIKITSELPIDKHVVYHSIIGNNERAGIAGGTDGIVPYQSAHLDGAVSELIIHSGHSGQKTPAAIMEVDRILREHLKR